MQHSELHAIEIFTTYEMLSPLCRFCFFFQAEDGIRDYKVTGVQTCALPISDIVIMDISMPGRGGIDAIQHIRQLDVHARILVFTMHGGALYALQAFRAGAKGYEIGRASCRERV